MRLFFKTSSGEQTGAPAFTRPYGTGFLAVDGECRYHVAGNYMQGVMTGTLTATEAEKLSADLHWHDLERWADDAWGTACYDDAYDSLLIPNVRASCSEPDHATELAEAISNAHTWLTTLMQNGQPLDAPVGAALVPTSFSKDLAQPVVAWPLARPANWIRGLIVESGSPTVSSGPWTVFKNESEYSKLRELRTATLHLETTLEYTPNAIYVSDRGMDFYLFVRDELPDHFEWTRTVLQATVQPIRFD